MLFRSVATHIGAEGVEATREEGLIVEDDPQRQADEIIRLLGDFNERTRLSNAAMDYVNQHHEWSASIDRIANYYRRLATHAMR